MAEERFDLSYSGGLLTGAEQSEVRERLTAVFGLSEAGAMRLFTGQPVMVKRDADAATAARFGAVFTQAGAILRITPVESYEENSAGASVRGGDQLPTARSENGDTDAASLALAADNGFLEQPCTVNIAAFDTRGLSLVSEPDWSLADCAPPTTRIPIPDIGHLSLAETEPPSNSGKRSE
jgi:hypothetical protein